MLQSSPPSSSEQTPRDLGPAPLPANAAAFKPVELAHRWRSDLDTFTR